MRKGGTNNMAKTQAKPIVPLDTEDEGRKREHHTGGQQPLSGSKKVKNRNHTRSNHGEGS